MRSFITTSLALTLAACGSNGNDGKTKTSTSSGSGSSGGSPIFNPTCPSGCPKGQFCFDGLCAIGCLADSDCSSSQYCDTQWSHLCQDEQVPSCSSSSGCQGGQQCVEGLCTAALTQQPASPCNPNVNLASGQSDGCDATSVCLQAKDSNGNPTGSPYCETFPACGAPGSNPECPVGQYGALCNDGYLSAKGRFCMPSLCKTQGNCPSGWGCVTFPSGPGLGACSNGSLGSVCDPNHPCQSGLSCEAELGSFGQCLPSGGIGGLTIGGSSGGGSSGGGLGSTTGSGGSSSGASGSTGGGAGSSSGGSTSGGSSGGSGCPNGPGATAVGGSCQGPCDCQSEFCQDTGATGLPSSCCSGPGTSSQSCSSSCDCLWGMGCTSNGTCCGGPGAFPSGEPCSSDCDCSSLSCLAGSCG
ncbi:MAG: hypothetical protein ACYDCL_22270 [Myxococcales bacterium]